MRGIIASARGNATVPTGGGSVIQQSPKQRSAGVAGVQTYTNALPVQPTPGNALILVMNVYHQDGAPSAISIGGDAATLDSSYDHSGGDATAQVWRVQSASGTNRNIVVTPGNPGINNYYTFAALECSPLASTPEDLDLSAGITTSTAPSITAGGNTAQANELVVAQWIVTVGSGSVGSSTPAVTGYTSLFVENDSLTYQGGEASYKVLSSIQTPSASWTQSSSLGWFCQMVSYKFQ